MGGTNGKKALHVATFRDGIASSKMAKSFDKPSAI